MRMQQPEIFRSVFAMMFLTMAVWLYMYARRIPFILESRLRPEQLTPVEFARISPPAVRNPSDNLKNLFEIPTLFYFLALYLYARQQVDPTYLAAAWIFVGFRVAHSIVHCSINIIPLRFWLYAASTAALWFMVIRAAGRLI
jgi:hypothetical protein